MSISEIRSYVYYQNEKSVSLDLLKQMIVCFGFFTFIMQVFGAVDRHLLPYSIALLILTLLYAAGVLVFQKNCHKLNSFSVRFLVNGIFATFSSIFFLIIAHLFLAMDDTVTVVYKLAIPACLFFFDLLFIIATVSSVRKRKNRNRKPGLSNKISLWASCGALIGVFFARVFLKSVDNKTAIDIAVFGCSMLSLLFSLGTANYLKYYWCKKYSITCDENGKNATQSLYCVREKTKQSIAKKIMKTFLWALFVLLLVGSLIGVYETNK